MTTASISTHILTPSPVLPRREGTPLLLCPVVAGFPSPAEDYIERHLDLHAYVVRNQAATYFVRAAGDSMTGVGITEGDMLVVDRSVNAVSGSIVIAAVDGELTVKRLKKSKGRVCLVPENPDYPPLDVTGREDVEIWGVVTHAVHSFTSKVSGLSLKDRGKDKKEGIPGLSLICPQGIKFPPKERRLPCGTQ